MIKTTLKISICHYDFGENIFLRLANIQYWLFDIAYRWILFQTIWKIFDCNGKTGARRNDPECNVRV